jgi:hypothetical protein
MTMIDFDVSDRTRGVSREDILYHLAEYGFMSNSQQMAYLTLLERGDITEQDLLGARATYVRRAAERAVDDLL